MTELEIVLNGIEEVEKSGLVCGICGDACHHFPDSLIDDIKNLLIKQNNIIEKYHRADEFLDAHGLMKWEILFVDGTRKIITANSMEEMYSQIHCQYFSIIRIE